MLWTIWSGVLASAVTVQSAAPARPWIVQATGYSTEVGENGIIDTFKMPGGVELLRSNRAGVHGVILMEPTGIVALPEIERLDDGILEFRGPKATLRYAFSESGIECTVNNRSSDPLTLVFNFAAEYKMIRAEGDQWHPYPVTGKAWPEARFYMESGAGLAVEGSVGYWTSLDGLEYGHVAIAPGAEYRCRLAAIEATETERAEIGHAIRPWRMETGLVIQSPRNWQVFQRQSRFGGRMLLSGRVEESCDRLEYRLTGSPLKGRLSGKWRRLAFFESDSSFQTWIDAPAGGWYRLEMRAARNGKPVLSQTIDHVGVGEVFVGAGQSNSTNWGQFPIEQSSGMVAATDGVLWQLSADPQPGTHDRSSWGSFWPAFGDAMYERYRVPIGVAVAGHGGTSVAQWQPGGELHRWMMGRIHQLGRGGFRALLWHQGESEVFIKTPPERYYEDQKDIIRASQYEAGWEFPWFLAQVSYLNPGAPADDEIRAVQKRLWDEGLAWPGPDTDTLTGDYRDREGKGIHLSPKGLKAHGEMWAEKVAAYLNPILADE